MKTNKKETVCTVAEFFETYYPSWLDSYLSEAEKAEFLANWWMLAKPGHVLFDYMQTFAVCDLPLEGVVLKVLKDTLYSMTKHMKNHNLMLKIVAELFEIEPTKLDIETTDALCQQFAKVYLQHYLNSSVYHLKVTDTFQIEFTDGAILGLMAYAHGLADDVWGLQFHGMSEWRYAYNGKDWAWFPKGACTFQGKWLTVKEYESIQKRLGGF